MGAESEYEDYIIDKPERFARKPPDIFEHAKEQQIILTALNKGNMTVKEIHDLYRLPNGKHSKTLKTIYRYLEALEEYGLVKLAGHRKTKGKRTLEKLYCRTAKVFFIDDEASKEQWLTSEKGDRFVTILTDLAWMLHDKKGDKEQIKKGIAEFYRSGQTVIEKIIDKVMTDEEFAETMDKYSLGEAQKALDILGHIGLAVNDHEAIDKLKKLFS